MKNIRKPTAFLLAFALILSLPPMAVLADPTTYMVSNEFELSAALGSLVSGDTIKLTADFDYPYGISIDNMAVVFDLNDHVLNICNNSGNALSVTGRGDVQLTGNGEFNVTADDGPFFGAFVSDDSSATITNAYAIGDNGNGAYASMGGSITVINNVSASGIQCYAAYADLGGNISIGGTAIANGDSCCGAKVWDGTIIINGNVEVSGLACYGTNINDGEITVKGDITATGISCQGAVCYTMSSHSRAVIEGDITVSGDGSYGASSNVSGSSVLVEGNIKTSGDFSYGAQAVNEGIITVNGSSTANGNSSCTVYADGINSVIQLWQDAVASGLGVYAVYAGTGSMVGVGRNASAAGIGRSYGAYAYGGTIDIGGDLFAAGNGVGSIGASADSSGVITVGGSVTTEDEESRGAVSYGAGSNITIGNNVAAGGDRCHGVLADLSGKVTVNGDITAGSAANSNAVGAKADNGGVVIVNGNTAAIGRESCGAFADKSGSQVIITGSAAAAGESCIGALADNGGRVTVNKNIAADGDTCFGVKTDNNSKTTVNGNITVNSIISGFDSTGVKADHSSTSTVSGIITVNGINNRGASADNGSVITIDGSINALYPIILNGLNIDSMTPSVNSNYLIYTKPPKTATIRIRLPLTPVILTQPADAARYETQQAVFAVTAAVPDGGKLSYLWEKSASGGSWNAVSGATNTSITIAAVSAGDNGNKYRCRIRNTKNGAYSTIYTNEVTLTVNLLKTLVSISTPDTITGMPNGTSKTAAALGLPATVIMATNSGNVSADVSWNVAGCSYNAAAAAAQTFDVTGTAILPAGVVNTNSVPLTIHISVSVLAKSSDNTGGKSSSKQDLKGTVVTMNLYELNSAFNKTEAGSDGIKQLKIQMPEIRNANQYILELPVPALTSEKEEKRIEMSSKIGTVVFPEDMLRGSGIADKEKVRISLGEGDKSALSPEIKKRIGGRPVIELKLTAGNNTVAWNNPDAPVTVSVPYAPTEKELQDPEHIVVWYIDGKGNLAEVPSGRYDAGTGMVTFRTTHFSKYAIAYVTKTFDDLGTTAWAQKPIEVLASKGIVEGVSEKEFAPKTSITRGDFLCFLIRTLNIEADFEGNFDDIGKDDDYYNEIGTARKLGITTGSGKNQFHPDDEMSRQDMMVLTERTLEMLDKFKQEKEGSSLCRFTDNDKIAAYAKGSVDLLAQEGLITGSGGRLNPRGNTTRAEAAVFLYRIYKKYN